MDIRLFLRVIWHYKWLVLGGVLTGAVVAAFTYGTPALSHGRPTLKPRGSELWGSQSEALIAAPTDPLWSLPTSQSAFTAGNPASLGLIYSQLFGSDGVQAQLHRIVPVAGSVFVTPVGTTGSNGLTKALPFLTFTASAPTASAAQRLANAAPAALQSYVLQQQLAEHVPPSDAVRLDVVQKASGAFLEVGHKTTTAMLVFGAFLIGTILLAFMLEKGRVRAVAEKNGHAAHNGHAGAFDEAFLSRPLHDPSLATSGLTPAPDTPSS